MNPSRSVGWLLGVSLLVYAAAGCSTPAPDRNPGAGTGASTNAGTTGAPAAGGAVGLSFGGSTSMPGGGASNGGETCAATTTTAKLVPLDLYVLMDSSKSMLEPTSAGATKWKAVTDALGAFFQDAKSDGLSVGLKYFPDEQPVPATCTLDAECGSFGPCDQRRACVKKGTAATTFSVLCSDAVPCAADESCVPVQRCADGANCSKRYCVADTGAACAADCKPFTGYCHNRDVCTAETYATPAVPFGELPAAAPALIASLAARTPDGFTPTGPALTGALQQARLRSSQLPDHKVAVVLVTDGLPGGFIPNNPPAACTPGDIAGVASVLAAGVSGTPPVPTFVIGVFGPCDLTDANVMPQANLDSLAVAGGTQKSVVISTDQNVAQQLQDALRLVRSSAIACKYTIPPPTNGALDFGKVNVNFTAAGNTTVVGYVGGSDDSKCDARGGWHYDKDPTTGGVPTQVVVCPQSCTRFQAIADARVDIALGCETVIVR